MCVCVCVAVVAACGRWHAAKMTEQFKAINAQRYQSVSEIIPDKLPVQAQPDDTLWNIPSQHMSNCLLLLVYINTKCCRGEEEGREGGRGGVEESRYTIRQSRRINNNLWQIITYQLKLLSCLIRQRSLNSANLNLNQS